jgi:hypothetical protein
MKIQGWIGIGALFSCILWACGGNSGLESPQQSDPPSSPEEVEITPPNRIEVRGSAQFGNQCPYGSFVPPTPAPLEMWDCPIGLSSVELTEPLAPLVLQADCKKKTLDIRSQDPSITPITWEVMPDGNFFFSMNAGYAKLKEDGAGHFNCASPVAADIWGKIDCKDRDKTTIRVETVWWLGKTLKEVSGTPSPLPDASPSPSGSPSSTPSGQPSGQPSAGPSSSPWPVFTPHPRPRPEPTPNPRRSNRPRRPVTGDLTGGAPQCVLPTGCYLHNITQIDQCS